MSQTELHIGRLVKVEKLNPEETVAEISKRILNGVGVNVNPDESAYGQLTDHFSEKYIIHNNELYEGQNKEMDSGDDICEATLQEDGSIRYVLQFYNGGTYFGEMLEDALKGIK